MEKWKLSVLFRFLSKTRRPVLWVGREKITNGLTGPVRSGRDVISGSRNETPLLRHLTNRKIFDVYGTKQR